ncbi:MAG: tRNA 2-thiocytidine(32) synthetase TtcA [Clostridia bacterium]|nr:tRNA 2-thiocytidine(32) synthetase TtcA [Clostridia bacterium]
MQYVLGALRRAVQDFDMIKEGDKIAVGLSGGKDSLLLLDALERYRKFSPVNFTLCAIHIDMGFKSDDTDRLRPLIEHVESQDVELHIVKTDLAEIIFDIRKEPNPCSLCSKMRRGALCNAAKEFGANKVALGHHADDVLETFMLSLAYEGRFSTFQPTSYMSRSEITVIRPFIYLEESEVKRAIRKLDLPVIPNLCPADKHTQRQAVKEYAAELNSRIPGVKQRMLSAIYHPERNSLWQEPAKPRGRKTPTKKSDQT